MIGYSLLLCSFDPFGFCIILYLYAMHTYVHISLYPYSYSLHTQSTLDYMYITYNYLILPMSSIQKNEIKKKGMENERNGAA